MGLISGIITVINLIIGDWGMNKSKQEEGGKSKEISWI